MSGKSNPFSEMSAKRKEEMKNIVDEAKNDNHNTSKILEKKEEAKSTKRETKDESIEDSAAKKAASKKEQVKSQKKKIGRPKSNPYIKISINIPEEYSGHINIKSALNYNRNISAYIADLIRSDIEKNGDLSKKYK